MLYTYVLFSIHSLNQRLLHFSVLLLNWLFNVHRNRFTVIASSRLLIDVIVLLILCLEVFLRWSLLLRSVIKIASQPSQISCLL